MPEGPEVQTVINTLKRKILKKKILDIEVRWPNILVDLTILEFKEKLIGKTIVNIERKGKFILFDLEDSYLISHLRMEGKYFVKKKGLERAKHDYIIFTLDSNEELIYNDTRKFGKMYVMDKDNIENKKPLNILGIDPFDKQLDGTYLQKILTKKSKPIKSLLLDQSIISGIGNIYADEILFHSSINPLKVGKLLTVNECQKICENTREVFRKAIAAGGTTIRSYTSDEGISGLFQFDLAVHQRKNEKCKVCNTNIIKIKVGGRGTYYCPTCQKIGELDEHH